MKALPIIFKRSANHGILRANGGTDGLCRFTAFHLYLMENDERYEAPLDRFFSAMDEGRFRVIASTIVLAEVLVKPYRLEQWEIAKKYELIFEGIPHLSQLPVDRKIARTAAKLRAAHSLLTPDAVHLATAVTSEADFFLTNDRDFKKVDKPNSRFPKLVFIDDL